MSTQTAEMEWGTYNLTSFQMEECKRIRGLHDFKCWMSAGPIDVAREGVRKQRPITILYRLEDNILRAVRIGKNRVLYRINSMTGVEK